MKAIYKPKGKANEYGMYGCNLHRGCSNDCRYCYLKRPPMSVYWGTTPTLKKCFKDEDDAVRVFREELLKNLPDLQKHGLFMSFTTDPLLPETIGLTLKVIEICTKNGVNVKLLTKCGGFEGSFFNLFNGSESELKAHVAFGFTLTGHNEWEPGAPGNEKRIESMRKLHSCGYRTFESDEPIMDFGSTMKMITETLDCCDLYKIGLMSGGGVTYDPKEAQDFLRGLKQLPGQPKIYLKDSLVRLLKLDRNTLPSNFVGKDYDMFQYKNNNPNNE